MSLRRIDSDSENIISEINIIPLVDISLVLLIIFMVTASYITNTSIRVDIPTAVAGKEVPAADSSVTITISREGPVYLNNSVVTVRDLKEKMRALQAKNSGQSVILSVDKSVNFKSVVGILDILSELGITNLNIATAGE